MFEWDVDLSAGTYSAVGNLYTDNNDSDGVLNSEIVDWSIDLQDNGVTQFTLTPANTQPLSIRNSDNSLVITGAAVPKDMALSNTTSFASFTMADNTGDNILFLGNRDLFSDTQTRITIGGTTEDTFPGDGTPFAVGGDAVAVPFEFSPSTGIAISLSLFGLHQYQRRGKQKAADILNK